MATSLPSTVQLKLEQVLDQYRHWRLDAPLAQRPEPVSRLDGGLSNYSFLVGEDTRFVVRIDGAETARHGLNRQAEWRILQAASADSLAPAPRYFNPELGALVVDYLLPDEPRQDSPGEIASLLHRIHRLPPLHIRLDLGERILRYRHRVDQRGAGMPAELLALEPQLAACLDYHSGSVTQAVVCHNDLLPANRLRSGNRLYALDWEYCAMGNAWFDLAVVCCGHDFGAGDQETLLEAYLDRGPGDEDRQHLRVAIALYLYLESLWHLAADSGDRAPPLTRVSHAFGGL